MVPAATWFCPLRPGIYWRRIPLTRAAGHWLATIHNPAESGYASLRATAADSAHDTVTQTIIRAYAVARLTG